MDEAMAQGARQAGKIGPATAPERLAVLHPEPHAILLRLGRRPIGGPGGHAVERKGQGQGGTGAFIARGEQLAMGDFPGDQAGTPCIDLPCSEAGGSGNGTDFDHRIAPGANNVLIMFSFAGAGNGAGVDSTGDKPGDDWGKTGAKAQHNPG
ncbi:D-alanine--poly(phosphoribitol) ligase subunit 1 [Novosphingobium sp. PY1]|nr:D-alanine--poly(phosphoribitol) ligase subunit 1 [Novosphingobium sp. PY1]